MTPYAVLQEQNPPGICVIKLISSEIKWPVNVKSLTDSALDWTLANVDELGTTVEFWNSDIMQNPLVDGKEECILTDASGRELDGKIEKLEVLELYLKPSVIEEES